VERDLDYAEVVASTAGAAFAVDTGGRIVAWNAAAEDLFGYPAAKAIGRFCWDVLQGRDLFENVYCGPHCPLIEMAVHRQPIHRCDLLFRHAQGDMVHTAVNSFIVSGRSAPDMTIVHFLNPMQHEVTVTPHQPDVSLHETKHPLLTERELQVLRLMAQGGTTREISRELRISAGTVRNHTGKILRTLKAHTRLQAVAAARALRLIT
jgi:PAS domain S-box-containing protein